MPTTSMPTLHRGAILAIILLSYFMILLDASVILTALPALERELHLTPSALSWVQDAYTLVFGGLLLLGARAGDLLGRRRVFVFGLAVFTVASLLIGLAPAGWWLIGSRALQGVGAAIVAPASLSLLTASFTEPRERTRAVAWYSATAGIGSSIGLVIGGAFAHFISWRAGFFINLPIGIAMIALAPRFIPESNREQGRFDLVGALTATFGVGSLVYGIINTADAGWTSPVTLGALALGVVLLVWLVLNEQRAAQPIMPLRLFRSRERTGAYLARFFFVASMIGFFYFTTQFMQNVLGWNPLQAGLGFLPMTMVNFFVAIAIPRIVQRFGNVLPLIIGVVLSLAGTWWLSQAGVGCSYLGDVALPMVLLGAGQGLSFGPLTSAGIAGTTAGDAGAASGLFNSFHQLGMCVGLAVMVAVAVPAGSGTSPADVAQQVGTALTVGSVFLVGCLVCVCGLILPATRRQATRG